MSPRDAHERGEQLYRLTSAYAALGDHRSGTDVDDATLEWFAAELRARGAFVDRQVWSFDRYDARWQVTIDGDEVPALPLFYEAIGRVSTDAPATSTQRVLAGASLPDLQGAVIAARSRGSSALVIATASGTGRLMAVNRSPVLANGLPTLCVSGALAPVLPSAETKVEFEARLSPGRSGNVVGRFGSSRIEDTVVIGTPLSGWFRCAGERGTGVAIALELATIVAAHAPVLVVGTSGHELEGLGQRVFLDGLEGRPRGVVHLGASVGAGNGDLRQLAEGVRMSGWLGPGRGSDIQAAFAGLGRPVHVPDDDRATDPSRWLGEARSWSGLGVPMVSAAGGFALFHAPEDLPRAATTPKLLSQAFDAMARGAALLL